MPKEGTRVSGFVLNQHRDLAGYKKYLNSINTEKIEAVARVPLGPEVGGMDDLKKYLKQEKRDDVARNILRRLLSYGIGRELGAHDRFMVDDLLQRSSSKGHRLLDMIIIICKSELFRNP